jgi:hypothetical protein
MIEMLGDFIIAILGKIKKGDTEQANKQLEQIYYDFLKNDAAFFRSLTENQLTESLLAEHNYTHGHLQILSELFLVEAELRAARKEFTESKSYLKKSLKIFEFIDVEMKTFDEVRLNKIKQIRERIIGFENS